MNKQIKMQCLKDIEQQEQENKVLAVYNKLITDKKYRQQLQQQAGYKGFESEEALIVIEAFKRYNIYKKRNRFERWKVWKKKKIKK